MRQVDDGKEYVFNRGGPVGGLISHSNNEPQEVSIGHSSDDTWGNLRRAMARTVSCWSKNLIEGNIYSIICVLCKHRMHSTLEKIGETTHVT